MRSYRLGAIWAVDGRLERGGFIGLGGDLALGKQALEHALAGFACRQQQAGFA